MLSPKRRRLLKWIGYPLFSLGCFVVCLYATFPYFRVKQLIEQYLPADGKWRLTIEEVGPSPLLGLTLSGIRLTMIPKKTARRSLAVTAGVKPATPKPVKARVIRIESLRVNSGLLAAVLGKIDFSRILTHF